MFWFFVFLFFAIILQNNCAAQNNQIFNGDAECEPSHAPVYPNLFTIFVKKRTPFLYYHTITVAGVRSSSYLVLFVSIGSNARRPTRTLTKILSKLKTDRQKRQSLKYQRDLP